jgi:hypothetical protein
MIEAKKIVLIANKKILQALSDQLTQYGYEILRELPLVTDLVVNDIITLKPDVIFISEGSQFDDDFTLLRTIHYFKSINKIRARIIVHTRTRKIGDDLLSDLISLNVYDFIALSSFDIAEIIKLIENPRVYSDVSEYHNYAKESSSLDISLDLPHDIEPSLPEEQAPPLVQPPTTNYIKEKMLGTATISVGNLQHGSGATYTALTIAKFLSGKGYKVAVVELKQKTTYGLIYLPREQSYSQYSFKYQTFDIYANDGEATPDELLIDAMSKDYNYIILDVGLIFEYDFEIGGLNKPETPIKNYKKGNFYNDFMKADVKIVNTFASLQYADSLEYFLNYLNVWHIYDLLILLNFTSEDTFKSYRSNQKLKIYPTPYNAEATLTEEQIDFFNQLLTKIVPKDYSAKEILFGKNIKSFLSSMGTPIVASVNKVSKVISAKTKVK